jgi:hypothetical protein
MREIRKAECSCWGTVERVDATPEEERNFGCSRPGCCCIVLQCDWCNTRFVIGVESPEMD